MSSMMRGLTGVLLAATQTLAVAQPAATSTVYRCGPEGKQYSATPCPAGSALPDDARTVQQRREAEDIAERERKLADKLAAERVAREKAIVPTTAANVGPSAKPASAASAPKKGKPKKKPKASAAKA
ncbi:hypothetical protein HLB44_33615 [Aquincola sp. S2]|uniref:DUF4124 domain-containing protein n=1 Tax=Pseudaquabacterium terrae TaxID=2732868 RepID=A0ABX2ETZ1_9BURK|nr:hypothetical protein [Aquabacterium terrae]NRF71936.1 hypothetical protein [Aquabacterium terrae]